MSVSIRGMQESELDFAAGLTAAEGWVGETRREFEGHFAYDPGGCLVAEEDGEPIGICVATPYGGSGFIGELVVAQTARGRGVGQSLLESGLAYLRDRGAASVLLDGVVRAVPLYERVGFRRVCRSLRYHGRLSAPSQSARPMEERDLPAVLEMDLAAFGADRSFFLRRSWQQSPQLCYTLYDRTRLTGYIMARQAGEALRVGPWAVRRGAARAEELLAALGNGGTVELHLGVLSSNLEAQALLRTLGMVERAEPPWRMVAGPPSRLAASDRLYATGSAAKG